MLHELMRALYIPCVLSRLPALFKGHWRVMSLWRKTGDCHFPSRSFQLISYVISYIFKFLYLLYHHMPCRWLHIIEFPHGIYYYINCYIYDYNCACKFTRRFLPRGWGMRTPGEGGVLESSDSCKRSTQSKIYRTLMNAVRECERSEGGTIFIS